MVTKLKVKDLAAELGIGQREILQHLRDMDIQVKSFSSTLEDDEVDRVRQTLRGTPTTQTQVVRREVQPGVIVRSRKAKAGGEERHEEPVSEARPEPVAEPKAEPVARAAKEVSAPEAPAAPADEKAPEAEARATAKVVRRPAEPATDRPARIVSEAKPEPKPAPAPEAKAEAAAAPAPEAAAEPVAEPVKEAPAPQPAVRIISEPKAKEAEPAPKAEAAAPAPAAEAKPEAAPAAEAPKAEAQAEAPKVEAPEAEKADGEEPKRKQKREVIVPPAPQVRIISRPEPGSTPPASSQPRRPEFSATHHEGGARPYTPRQNAGGAPGGYAGGGGYGQRRDGAPGDRPGGPGGAPRPGGGGYAPRPAGGPGGGYGQRPAGGTGGPGGGPAAPPKDGDDRRRKPHRVVEFPGGGGGSDDDRRKAGPSTAKKKPSFAPAPILSEDGDAPMRLKSSRHKKRRGGMEQREEQKPVGKRKIRIDEHIRLSDLAHQMGIKAQAIIKVLFGMGMMATINQALDMDTATLLAAEFGHEVENVSFDEQEFLSTSAPDTAEDLKPRPPVVTIMGHVDHGKTSLLDAIRKTSIASGEAGGITQHIGAYHVATNRGEVVFLDTPGHEAFTTMRARGAQVTDIVVLVVAADDGVMDQTREAVNHAKAANVPIVVAVNKIDKEGANPDRVKRELAEFDLVPEEWGGTTIFAPVSAKQRIGLDELLEMILLQAEVLELKANPSKPARGHIVEAKLDKGRGPLGTVLIQEGTLKNGDAFVCGSVHGKVRAMFNDQGRKIKQAGPAIPVEIQGFDVVPEAGDEFVVVADDKVARKIAETRAAKQREKDMVGKSKLTLESFLSSSPTNEAKTLNLVLKADVQGSLEAISEALTKLSTDEVKIQVVHGATGGLTESDILLATASQAIIIGFNVRPTAKVKEMADAEHVEIRFYDIIYKLVGEIKDAMSGMLSPDIQEVYLGQAEVRNTFSVPKVGMVAGCGVVDGKLTRAAKVRLLRDGVVIYTGALSSLKRFKDDAKEVMKGYECGVGLENFNDIKIGDVIEAFETKEVARTID
ncbi:MAG: translation initiation factor IF-2 [Desulfovibrio sp.]|jgi:translation initiation factor IF-2|nr:translation initiation factor IF-2 [Desulfovibrio sp.]